jgi:lysozyme
MTSQYLIPDLKADEGFRAQAYPDPLSGNDPWTIGYGSTGPNVVPGLVWTEERAGLELSSRVASLTAQLAMSLDAWWDTIGDLRQDVLVNMAYNLGLHGLLAFHDTLAFIGQHDYADAASAMLQSKWAKQVPNRAHRLSEQMRTGVHA